MSKPMLVTLPFVLLLLDYWPLGRNAEGRMMNDEVSHPQLAAGPSSSSSSSSSLSSSSTPPKKPSTTTRTTTRTSGAEQRFTSFLPLLLEKAPFFALAAASSVVTFLVQQRAGAVAAAAALPLAERVQNAAVSYLLYLTMTVWPSGLAVFYPHPHDTPENWLALAALVLIVVSALAWVWRRPRPYLAVGWLWFLGTLVPVIGLVQVGQQAMADRYTYLPLIGVFIAFAWGLADLIGPRCASELVAADGSPRILPQPAKSAPTAVGGYVYLAAGALLVLAACWTVTHAQVRHWQNSETLFRHALAVTTDNALAHESLGDALAKAGRVEEAEPHFAEAVRLWPKYPEALSDLGLTRVMHGQVDEGIALYRAALAVKPGNWTVHNNLARALCLQGKLDEGVKEYQTVLELNPGATDARGFLAATLVELGRTNEASQVFEDALRLRPADAAVQFKYASLLMVLGQTDAAATHFRAALQSEPGGAEIHRRYGLLLAGNGQTPEAIAQYREAIRLQPSAEAHYNLAAALLQQGQAGQAAAEYRESLRLSPDSPAVLNDLAWLLAASADPSLRNGTEAVSLAERACQLTEYRQPLLVGTLAAAYAEAGRFTDAVQAAEKAIAAATAAGQTNVADRNRELLLLYRAGKPFHETRQ